MQVIRLLAEVNGLEGDGRADGTATATEDSARMVGKRGGRTDVDSGSDGYVRE